MSGPFKSRAGMYDRTYLKACRERRAETRASADANAPLI